MKITDLLDDYYDDSVNLPECSVPSDRAVLERTKKKLGITRKKRRIPKGILIAAALILALSITAGAVGYTVWDAARKDAGLEDGQSIPEYTEYHDSAQNTPAGTTENLTEPAESLAEAAENLTTGTELKLVSTLGSGSDLSIYMTASPVTPEQAERLREENQGLDTFATWDLNVKDDRYVEMDGTKFGAKQLEYDPETGTALICGSIHGDFLSGITEVTVTVDYFYQSDGNTEVIDYGSLTVPFTMSEELVFQPEVTLENAYVDAWGTVAQVTVYASYISIRLNLERFNDWCSRTGDDAWFRMGDAFWGSDDEAAGEERRTEYTELDAWVAYRRSWERALRGLLLTDCCLTLKDGSVISLYDPQFIGAGDETGLEGTYTEDFELPAAVNLEEVESLTLGGVTYFPAG